MGFRTSSPFYYWMSVQKKLLATMHAALSYEGVRDAPLYVIDASVGRASGAAGHALNLAHSLEHATFFPSAPFSLLTKVTIMQNIRCAANDGVAIDVRDQLMDHVPRLRRYSRALIRNHDLADDLVQDTLHRALQRLEQFERDTDLRAWLFTIMHNLFANQRRHASMRAVHVSVDDEGVPETEFAVAANQTQRLEVRDLDAALQMLSIDQREVVLLIGLEEMSYTDAAFTLGIPVGTVMSRLSRGRERLRVLMMGRNDGREAAKANAAVG